MRIEKISYEKDRLSFFIEQRELAEKRYKRAIKAMKPDDSYLSDAHFLASKTGQELSFYDDVVRMLAEKLSEKQQVNFKEQW